MTTLSTVSSDTELRDQLSNLQGLLMLTMLMTESGEQAKILELATTSVPSLGRCRARGVYLAEGGWWPPVVAADDVAARYAMDSQLAALGSSGGRVVFRDEPWAWALPLRGREGHVGYFLVSAAEEPSGPEQFLVRVLAQQTGVALANDRVHAKERAANVALAETVRALQQTTRIHDRFTRVAVAGEGREGIARAVHELTGYPVAVEDRYGNLRAWAGPNRPEPYPKDPAARREQMLRRALRDGRPVREGGRLLAIASPAADVLGVLALVDPARTAGDQELIALEHGATVLAMELARLRSLAEAELRVRRDLVEELLAGTDEESALARAQALGYDLEKPHRVVVAEGRGRIQDEDAFFHAVRRAARDVHAGTLLVARTGTVVVLADGDVSWDRFRDAVLTELGGGRCRLGVGGTCQRPVDFPRSFREAQLALKMQRTARGEDRATCYDQLGVYRILGQVEDPAEIERLVQQWLGALLAYDARKHSELVLTLCRYLECGGSYDATATALSVHRSSLKYRLQRIREISGHNLSDPDTHFNLQLATRAWQTLLTLRS
jgi:DNA-binding PucR family transcriptional regulator